MSEEQKIPENEQTISPPTDNENNTAQETVLIPQTTTNHVSQTEPAMEVQKHPHHPTHKKKWGEYVLEFLMIFLAVFLGFIAENIRENYVEHQRAKEYGQSLFNDLKKDTAEVNRIMSIKQWQNGNLDSLIIFLTDKEIQKNTRELYYYSCFANLPNLPFEPSDITIQQLRNSGSLRYFTSDHLHNTITQYYKDCTFYLEREMDITQQIPPLTLVAKIFSADQLKLMYDDIHPSWDITKAIRWPVKNQDFKLLGSYMEAWNEYSLYVQRLRRRNRLPMGFLRVIEKDQKELMTALKREYHVN